jgi:TonB-dependent starch-binding outer membrane protein SusC
VNTVLVGNPIENTPDALRTGVIQRYALSMTGGGDAYSFYLGGDRDTEQGVLFNSYNNRWSARGNFTFNPSEKVGFSVLLNFIQTDLRLPLGDESPASVLFTGVRGQPGRMAYTATADTGWNSYDPGTSNEYNNRTKTDRLTLGGTVNYTPFTWFRNRLTVGIDNTVAQAALLYLPGDEGEPGGATLGRTPITRILSIDYGGSIPVTLPRSLELTSSFGAQIVANRTETLAATGTGLGSPDVILIGNAATTSGSNGYSEANSVGYFVQEQLGWNDRLFVTGALRADDHSSFGSNFDWIVYPKLGASWVLSEEPSVSRFVDAARINSLKLRTAWGRAGRAPAPYSATRTYTVDRVTLGGGTASALRVLSYGNPDLKPEKGEELELGFDAGLFDDRLGIDFTYYDKVTTDMLTSLATAPSTGFPVSRTTNLGKVTNKGIELGVTGTPVQLKDVTWDSRVTFSSNKNRLVDFGVEGKTREAVTSPAGIQAYAVVQEHREGYPLAGYWAARPKLDETTGELQRTATGAILLDTAKYIGPSSPTRELGFSNTVTLFKNFRVYALLDWKGGMYLFNQKERNRCQTGVDNCIRVNRDAAARNPVTAADSNSAAYKEVLMWRTVPGMFIEKADFTKLREVSVTYTVPPKYLGRLGPSGASITFSGRNLALWSDYSGIDPETNSYGGRTFLRVDAFATPNPRRFVGSVNLTF